MYKEKNSIIIGNWLASSLASILPKTEILEFMSDKLPKDKKSYALSFSMVDNTKTLTDKHVDKVMDKLMKSFKEQVGAEIR